jgi:CDP-paratose 2-epimerase
MRVLITGVCGFVGSTLARALRESHSDWQVTGLDNLSRPGSWVNLAPLRALGVAVVHGDLRSPSDVDALPAAEWVIDAAANASVLAGVDGRTSSRQLLEHNLQGTVNVLEYCRQHGSGLVLLSTSRVYSIPGLTALELTVHDGAFRPAPDQDFPAGISASGVSESYSTAAPVSLYGSTKLASECLALEYGHTYGFPVWVNRCGVMAGAGQFGHPGQGIFAFWVHAFRERRPLRYIGFGGTGHQVRDCLHPVDLLPLLEKQFVAGLDAAKPRIINVSGGIGSSASLRQLSAWCAERFGANEITISAEERPYDIPWLALDPATAQSTWNWRPALALGDILTEIADFAEHHPQWLSLSLG